MIDGEEIKGSDIRFLHELKNSFYECGFSMADCSATIMQFLNTYKNGSYTGNTFQEKEKGNNMDIMKSFHFGPCGDRAKISHLGIAVKNLNDEWVSFDKENNKIVNVDLISFGDGDYVYMMPVALKNVAVGDAIVHNGHIMFVKRANSNCLSVIDVTAGELKKVLPTKSIFGFDFVTKVVSLIDFSGMAADEDNPFGNLLPFLLLGDKKGDDALPLALMMMGGNLSEQLNLGQSILMMAMLNNGKTGSSMSEILPLMFLMNGNMNQVTG